MFDAIHRLAHPGSRASRRLVLSHFDWKKCASDVTAWCRECQSCCRGSLLSPLPLCSQVQYLAAGSATFTWTLWALFLLLMTGIPTSSPWWDRRSGWLETAPLKGISAFTCADAFISTWVPDLVCLLFSHLIEVPSLPPQSGRCSATNWASLTPSQLHITRRAMDEVRAHWQLKDSFLKAGWS